MLSCDRVELIEEQKELMSEEMDRLKEDSQM